MFRQTTPSPDVSCYRWITSGLYQHTRSVDVTRNPHAVCTQISGCGSKRTLPVPEIYFSFYSSGDEESFFKHYFNAANKHLEHFKHKGVEI